MLQQMFHVTAARFHAVG